MTLNCLIFLACGVVGFGMWRLKPWAWIVTVSFAGLAACGSGFDLIRSTIHLRVYESVVFFVMTVPFTLLIYYFTRPAIRDLFGISSLQSS
jgi:hypothetical protein